jgi:hypothetical protein
MRTRGTRIVVVGLAVAALVTGCQGGNRDVTARRIPTTVAPPTTATPAPPLSEAEKAEAERIVRADPRVVAIVGPRTVSVDSVFPWGSDARDLGAAVKLSISTTPSPAAMPSGSPHAVLVDHPPAAGPYYTVTYPSEGATNVTQPIVLVDLGTKQVVSIEPGLGAHISRKGG